VQKYEFENDLQQRIIKGILNNSVSENKSINEFTLKGNNIQNSDIFENPLKPRKNASFTAFSMADKKYVSPKISVKNRGVFGIVIQPHRPSTEISSHHKHVLQTPQFKSKGKELESEKEVSEYGDLKEINSAIAKIIEEQYAVRKRKPMSAGIGIRRKHLEEKSMESDEKFSQGTVVNINIQKQTNFGNFIASSKQGQNIEIPHSSKQSTRVRPNSKKLIYEPVTGQPIRKAKQRPHI